MNDVAVLRISPEKRKELEEKLIDTMVEIYSKVVITGQGASPTVIAKKCLDTIFPEDDDGPHWLFGHLLKDSNG